jgi:Cysteine-rich secretory protein family
MPNKKLWKYLLVLVMTFSLVAGVGFSIYTCQKEARGSNLTVDFILNLINLERQKNSLPALIINNQIMQAATNKSLDMSKQGYFSHYNPQGIRGITLIKETGYNYQTAGENLAIYFDDSTELVNSWMSSSGHRVNILKTDYTHTGIGLIEGSFKGVKTTYITQMFATPIATVAPVQKQTTPTQTQVSSQQTPAPTTASSSSSQSQIIENIQSSTISQSSVNISSSSNSSLSTTENSSISINSTFSNSSNISINNNLFSEHSQNFAQQSSQSQNSQLSKLATDTNQSESSEIQTGGVIGNSNKTSSACWYKNFSTK